MTGILIALQIAMLVPLFVANWRTSLFGLFAQAMLMAWIALTQSSTFSVDTALTLVDLVLVRGVAMLGLIYVALLRRNAPPRNDVIAPNLLSWALALALIVMAFRSVDVLVPVEGDEQMLVAVAASGFILGLFVLATSRGVISQTVGLLRVDNAVVLYELGGGLHHEPTGIRAAKTALLIAVILFCRFYLLHVDRRFDRSGPPSSGAEAPVL